jgi:outer membrane murein-binding lipoprotein Lpp
MWRRALIAVVLVLAVSPALASDVKTGPLLAAAVVRAGDVASVSRAAADVHGLSARVDSLEQRVHQLSSTPTCEQQERAALAREREAEFLRHVWTDP